MDKVVNKNENNLKSQTLTIRLLKENTPIKHALNTDHGYTLEKTKNGSLYVIQSNELPPNWVDFLAELTQGEISKLTNQHCSAVLFLEVSRTDSKEKRIMALTFGYGHHALKSSLFERNFGLKVTLSAVTRTELISLDTATLDSTIFQRRIQASKKANFSGFGVNIERDLLRLAGGVPSDISFASMLIGKDALTITTKTSPDDFSIKCSKILDLFYSNSYKNEFDFIDHITPINNSEHTNYLDLFIFEEIKNMVSGKSSDLHLITPEITNPEISHEISYYGSGFNKGIKPSFSNVDIVDYISLLNNKDFKSITTFSTIKKNQYIYETQKGERNKKNKKKIYDCFIFEIDISPTKNSNKSKNSDSYPPNKPNDLSNGVYVLFSGNWYLVDKGFHSEIEKFYLRYLSKKPFLQQTSAKNEKDLISELNLNPNLLNLDQVKLNPTGMNNASIEPCDFLSNTLQFIHLKDGCSSGPISHLWNQGIVSAEAYLSDFKFKKDLSNAIKKRQKTFKREGFDTLLPKTNTKLDTSKITIIFGIMRTPYKSNGQVGLPFFSKVSFRPAAQAIERMGYKVELHLIEKM